MSDRLNSSKEVPCFPVPVGDNAHCQDEGRWYVLQKEWLPKLRSALAMPWLRKKCGLDPWLEIHHDLRIIMWMSAISCFLTFALLLHELTSPSVFP